jgi:hypothetical protein
MGRGAIPNNVAKYVRSSPHLCLTYLFVSGEERGEEDRK